VAIAEVFRSGHVPDHFLIASINKALEDRQISLAVGVINKAEANDGGIGLVDRLQSVAVPICLL
jgi:hypothetical protein